MKSVHRSLNINMMEKFPHHSVYRSYEMPYNTWIYFRDMASDG